MTGRRLGAVAVALLAAGCARAAVQPLPVVATATQPRNTAVTTPEAATPTTTTTTTTAPPTTTTPPVNARGNTTLALGAPAVTPDGWTLTVQDVVVGAPCPQQATRGRLLVATVLLETTPAYDASRPVPPAAADLAVVAADGTVTSDLETTPARSCDPGAARAPVSVRADTSYTFAVVLDSPVDAGTLALRPAGSPAGWEWTFPRA